MARERVVKKLMNEISGALAEACVADSSVTSDEVFSAVLTQARNLVAVARKKGVDPARLRRVVDSLLIEAFDPRRPS